ARAPAPTKTGMTMRCSTRCLSFPHSIATVAALSSGGGNVMTTLRRPLVSVILGLAILRCSTPVMATPNQSASDRDHVRAINPTIAMLIQHARERSHTFRDLLDRINGSDGIVYVEPGKCREGMHGCLVNVTMAGPTRLLWVKVDLRGNDCDLMGLI